MVLRALWELPRPNHFFQVKILTLTTFGSALIPLMICLYRLLDYFLGLNEQLSTIEQLTERKRIESFVEPEVLFNTLVFFFSLETVKGILLFLPAL